MHFSTVAIATILPSLSFATRLLTPKAADPLAQSDAVYRAPAGTTCPYIDNDGHANAGSGTRTNCCGQAEFVDLLEQNGKPNSPYDAPLVHDCRKLLEKFADDQVYATDRNGGYINVYGTCGFFVKVARYSEGDFAELGNSDITDLIHTLTDGTKYIHNEYGRINARGQTVTVTNDQVGVTCDNPEGKHATPVIFWLDNPASGPEGGADHDTY